MRRSNQREKCKRKSASESSSSEEVTTTTISQKDELPGVDYKNKLGPRSLRHNKLDLNKDEGEARFLNSVRKELNKRENVRKIQTAFQGDTTLASKSVIATNQYVMVNLSSPLDGISVPHYVEKWKNPGLIKDIPLKVEEEDDIQDGTVPAQHVRPTVLGVNMKWRNGIELKQCHKYTTKKIQLEPVMKKTEFDFETKTKFTAQVEDAINDLFHDSRNKLMVLDGNAVFVGHGNVNESSTKVARSEKLELDASPSVPHAGTGAGNPHAREWREYTDLEEHRLLVIPSYSRTGFDMDLQKKYEFPYSAKFVIGRKVYHHKFIVQVPLSRTPQHYGLIFTFSEDQNGHSKLRIKSLLTVYSIFPVSPKFASMETYEKNNLEDGNKSPTSTRKRNQNESKREAKNAVQLVTENLKEANLTTSACGGGFHMLRDLPQPAHNQSRYGRLYNDNLTGKKDKKKRHIEKDIAIEQTDNDAVTRQGKPYRHRR